jgi:hypothetical protein
MQSLEPAIYEVRAQGVKLPARRIGRNRAQARPEATGRTMRAPIPSAKSASFLILTTYGSFHQKAVLLKRINVIWSVHSHLKK